MLVREQIRRSLLQLSELLHPALERAERAFGVKYGEDLCQGLAVDFAGAKRGWDLSWVSSHSEELVAWHAAAASDELYLQLKRLLHGHLTTTDFGLLLLALAPEFDSGCERTYGYFQDDITRRRATVELASRLFDPSLDEASVVVQRLSGSAPLLYYKLIELVDPVDGRTGFGAKVIRLDDQFARWVFGVASLDRRLSGIAEVVEPQSALSTALVTPELRRTLEHIALMNPIRLHLFGPDERLHLRLAEGLAIADSAAHSGGRRKRVLIVDAVKLAGSDASTSETVRLLLREVERFNYVLVLTGLDSLQAPERKRGWEGLSAILSQQARCLVLSSSRPVLPATSYPLSVLPLEIPIPDENARFQYWSSILAGKADHLQMGEVEFLASRYSLTHTQIQLAYDEASARASLRAAESEKPAIAQITFEDLSIAARSQGGHDLETLTNKITPRVHLTDVVVPDDVKLQLEEVASRVKNRSWVLAKWGFGRRQSYGLGVNALFTGPSGTGKTMAAEALANSLGKDLYKIDLTTVVSKYIGETEQKLEQVFLAGEATQAVLFFDEADSLLGKRSEVKDAHDRYANLEVSYLLQRMERYDGLIVLATNLLGNLDDAFLRRMAAIVHFPKPAVAERRKLWEKALPRNDAGQLIVPVITERGFQIDNDFLAERFELTGGNIRNAMVSAAFSAADRPWYRFVIMWDVLQGVRREYQKLGQLMTDQDLGLGEFKKPPDPPPSGTAGQTQTPTSVLTPDEVEVSHAT